jgi:LysR family transcriptional activator of nhaA
MNPWSKLNYHHLRYFWMIANEGHLTRAAERYMFRNRRSASSCVNSRSRWGNLVHPGGQTAVTDRGRVIALDYANAIFRTGDELISLMQGHMARRATGAHRRGGDALPQLPDETGPTLLDRSDIELILRLAACRTAQATPYPYHRPGAVKPPGAA